jgi:hypothetical protein
MASGLARLSSETKMRMLMSRAITRTDIAEIHEAIAKRRPAQTEAEQRDQQWHAYAAKIIRENDHNSMAFSFKTGHESPGVGQRKFTHFKHWSPQA